MNISKTLKAGMWLVFFLCFVVLLSISSCNKEPAEDRIVTDLNEIFDPNNEGFTDWNYTEIDEEWIENAGLYWDSSIGEYRQKAEYAKKTEKRKYKAMNPITARIIQLVLVWLAINGFLVYCAYVQAIKLNRRPLMWMVNCFLGGIPTFIVLSLAPSLKYNKDLDIREESDLLGLVMFFSSVASFLMIYIIVSTCFMILENPQVLVDFIGK